MLLPGSGGWGGATTSAFCLAVPLILLPPIPDGGHPVGMVLTGRDDIGRSPRAATKTTAIPCRIARCLIGPDTAAASNTAAASVATLTLRPRMSLRAMRSNLPREFVRSHGEIASLAMTELGMGSIRHSQNTSCTVCFSAVAVGWIPHAFRSDIIIPYIENMRQPVDELSARRNAAARSSDSQRREADVKGTDARPASIRCDPSA
jgi:hypothetical protein